MKRRLSSCFGALVVSMAVYLPLASAQSAPTPEAKQPANVAVPEQSADGKSTGGVVEPDYDFRLRQLEEKVVGLKEKIYRSKSRLVLLREQILHNVIAEAKAIIVHHNTMSGAFSLEEVLYHLDGNKIYFRDNKDDVLNRQREFEVFNGNVMPGNHILSVEMVYRGDGGLFSYVDGYLFKIKSNYTFYASKGRISRVAVVGHERGGLTTSLEDKPYVSYEVQQFQYNKENLARLTQGEDTTK